MSDETRLTRRAAGACVLAAAGVGGAVVCGSSRPSSLAAAREAFHAGRALRERAGREAMRRRWEAGGLEPAASGNVSRTLRPPAGLSGHAEATDCDLACDVVQVYGFDQLFADARVEMTKNLDSPLGSDSGAPPADVFSMGWEYTTTIGTPWETPSRGIRSGGVR